MLSIRLACVLCVSVIFSRFGESEAAYCDPEAYGSTTEGPQQICCKVKTSVGRHESSQFYCEGGCCGDLNDEHCCSQSLINEEALPYVIGFSIFGVLVVVIVGVILFFVIRRALKGYKEHRKRMQGEYTAQTMEELTATGEKPLASPPGITVMCEENDKEDPSNA